MVGKIKLIEMKCIGIIASFMAFCSLASCGTQRKSTVSPTDGEVHETVSRAEGGIRATGSKPEEVNDAVAQSEARRDFSHKLFSQALLSARESENVVLSPYSAGVALSMLADGAAGKTREEIVAALSHAPYAGDSLYSDSVYKVASANSIWYREGFEIRDSYADRLKKDYGAGIFGRDFSSRSAVADINRWCADNTAGKIPEIVDNIDPDMMMFLLNALYFKASWEYAFDPVRNTEDVFHAPSGDSKVTFMHLSENLPCGEAEGFSYVVLPYRDGRYMMTVCLPEEGTDLVKAVNAVSPSKLASAIAMADGRDVQLSLPKFKVNTTHILNGILSDLGMKEAFGGKADFSGMTDSNVAVDEVKQKCFVEVNEEGSEAAAVTSIGIRMTSLRPDEEPFVMKVDRPFVFLITSDEGEVLFAGRIASIEK